MAGSKIPYFIWRDVRSTITGIVVREYPPITRPPERVSQVTVPGRSGQLTLLEDAEPVFEPYLRTLTCYVPALSVVKNVPLLLWLSGASRVIFGNEPRYAYDARIVNKIDFNRILRGRTAVDFSIPFLCQPYKHQYPAPGVTTISGAVGAVFNPGTVLSPARYTIRGSGDITLRFRSNSSDDRLTLYGVDGGIILDADTGQATSLDGAQLLNNQVDGEIPRLAAGDTTTIIITGSMTGMVVQPDWLYL